MESLQASLLWFCKREGSGGKKDHGFDVLEEAGSHDGDC